MKKRRKSKAEAAARLNSARAYLAYMIGEPAVDALDAYLAAWWQS